jgi:hypothetical protein
LIKLDCLKSHDPDCHDSFFKNVLQSGSPKRRVPKTEPETTKARNVDPKLGPPRKTAGVRNLPKIDRKNGLNAGSGDELVKF